MDNGETYYKELVENLNDGIYSVNVQTLHFSSANKAAEKLTGYKKSELLKMHVAKVVVPEYLPLVKNMINRKRKKAQSTIYEVEILRKDGKRVPVEISSLAIYKGDTPVEILGIARDISERKMDEHQRSIFVSLMTHEIKNPLTSIGIYLSLLKKRLKGDKDSNSYLNVISQQIGSVNNLLADFLDASQMRVGKFQITKGEHDLNEMIGEVVKTFQSPLKIKIKGRVKRKINADKNRICQVMTNLLSNAIKYSPQGKEIIISLEETESRVLLGVQDFGPGISTVDQKKIFELFYRTSRESQSNVKGHGLGLYISREIIKRHKGKLWVESTLQKGSTFYFSLPFGS